MMWRAFGASGHTITYAALTIVFCLFIFGLILGRYGDSSKNGNHAAGHAGCHHNYAVLTWDQVKVHLCQQHLCCDSRLQLLGDGSATTKIGVPRWDNATEQLYFSIYNKVEGWNERIIIDLIKSVTQIQHSLGLFGSVLEIGVHNGQLLAAIAGQALDNETVVALDLFDSQNENYDRSGGLSKQKFVEFLESVRIPQASMVLIASNSLDITARNFTQLAIPRFRMISVDGGHSFETTVHDLNLASCIIMDGGVIVVDDYLNAEWEGVTEAVIHVASTLKNLVPFLYGHNKIWFTTPSHSNTYYRLATKQFGCELAEVRMPSHFHISRYSLAGSPMCKLK